MGHAVSVTRTGARPGSFGRTEAAEQTGIDRQKLTSE